MNKLSSKKGVPGDRTKHKKSSSPTDELRRMKQELRIESSLEKIRKRTLKMQNSRELEKIAALFFRELKSLKAIPADARTYFSQVDPATISTLVWMTRPGGEIRPGSHRTPLTHPSVRKAFDAWEKKKALCVRDYSGRSLKSYLAFVKSLPHVKTDKAYQQLFKKPPERIVMSEALFKQGAIGVMTGQPLEKSGLDLLIRFANVFELAFTRFLDLKKAEEQTREVQVEAALEHLRVSVLAMKKPGDLIKTCGILFKQLKKLGFRDIRNSQIAIALDEKSAYMNYEYYDHDKTFVGEVPYHIHPFIREMATKMRKNKNAFFTETMTGERLADWKNFLLNLSREPAPKLQATEALHYYYYSLGPGGLGFCAYSPLSDEQKNVLMRFRNVFDFTYHRYLEMEQAIAHAREAKIEASLEKVRAQALGMHKSEDLLNVCRVLFIELTNLGYKNLRNAIIHTFNDEKEIFLDYDYSDQLGGHITAIPYKENIVIKDFIRQIRKSEQAFAGITITGKILDDWKKFRKKGGQPDDPKLNKASALHYYIYSVGNASVGISTFEPVREEKLQILKRFRNVFDFAYRRYQDVAEAEERAREAQVQLALERVRARTMAMQRSEELNEASFLLYEQFKKLGKDCEQFSVIIVHEDSRSIEVSATYQGSQFKQTLRLGYNEHPVIKKIARAWKSAKKSATLELTGETLRDYNRFRNTRTTDIQFHRKNSNRTDRWIINMAFFSKGLLSFSTDNPVPAETLHLLERFAGVFEQTYTRFLDLQKAEAQAREAQIEASLERVRAKAMAMHKSADLDQAILTVFEELEKLDLDLLRCGIGIINKENRTAELWTAVKKENKSVLEVSSKERLDQHPLSAGVFNAWLEQTDFSYTLEQKDLSSYHHTVRKTNKDLPRSRLLVQHTRDKKQYFYTSTFRAGDLYAFSENPYPDEHKKIIQRFARVLNLTFNRFLDLEKAEAQAREAEIQLALERVRARTMAMQKSEELSETALLMHRQFSSLVELPEKIRMVISILNQETKQFDLYITTADGTQLNKKFSYPITEPYVFHPAWLAVKNKKKSFIIDLSGKSLSDYAAYMENKGYPVNFRERAVISSATFSNGYFCLVTAEPVSDEILQLLSRFAGGFDLTYTRFLDLKKAEAQTREAQIEASLERVRSSAMAMHKSEDLKTCVATVFEELNRLDLGLIRCGIAILDREKPRGDIWIAIKKGKKEKIQVSGNEPLDIHPLLMGAYKAWLKKQDYAYALKKDDLHDYYRAIKDVDFLQPVTKSRKKENKKARQYYFNAVFQHGSLFAFLNDSISDEVRSVMKRFAGVLNLTYSRFLDLQKAEAQAREAQIEAALERVRAKAMAMHSSEDLSAAINVFFKQLKNLGLVPRRCGVGIINEADRTSFNMATTATTQGDSFKVSGKADMDSHPLLTKVFDHWEKQQEYFPVLDTEEVKEYTRVLRTQVAVTDFKDETQYGYFFPFKHGYFSIWSEKGLSEDELNICRRFTSVISLTYRRYLDLKEAEMQAREAQIETALERIRSRSMAMHHTSELQDVINTVHQQFRYLEIANTGGAFIVINKELIKEEKFLCWGAGGVADYVQRIEIPALNRPILTNLVDRIKKGPGFFAEEFTHREKIELFEHMFSYPPMSAASPERKKEVLSREGGYTRSCVISKHTSIFIINHHGERFSDAENDILKRFGKVFEQSYTRFLDLQKAEEQAREAQIEAALERVRAKAMAMHSSEDLAQTVSLFFSELGALQVMPHRCGVSMVNEETRVAAFVATSATEDGHTKEMSGLLKLAGHPVLEAIFESWKKQEEYHPVLKGEEIKMYYQVMNPQVEFPGFSTDAIQYGHYFSFKEGFVFTWTKNELTGDEIRIFRRFTSVISLTYRRYMDLKEAEEQAREAQIEAALERVRARTMAMHKSNELAETAAHLFKQFNELGIHPYRCNIAIIDEENKHCQLWSTTNKGDVIPVGSFIPMIEYPVLIRMYDDWKSKSGRRVLRLSGQERIDWIQYIRNYLPFAEYRPENIDMEQVKKEMAVFSYFPFKQGLTVIHTTEENSEADLKIMERFTKVFEQTYTRFLDLQKAEEQAREAVKQASLDRIRGQVASMRSAEDLERITPLIWQELTHLSIPFIRCGVFIVNEPNAVMDAYLSTPDGHALGLLHLPFDSSEVTRQTVEHWRKKEVYRDHWNKEQFLEWMQSMMEQGQINSELVYQGAANPPESLELHFVPFTQGMLYVGNSEPLNDGQVELVKALADAFSIAYARYEDFIKLEKAKQSIESALAELKATQAQLIQSEKMASLGELTAGIAHEIQNPLNFVNNFSDVSAELLSELKTEMENEHKDEALALLEDVMQNLEKILHHGKRADGIVKGMLQHSRTSGGQKEPTDINLLTDEYLRLAFHGLRAKDKSFSAKFETDFDSTIEKLNIVPQEIGRVILNLINNAFYAVTERKKTLDAAGSSGADYEPVVTVSTKKNENKIEIKIKDNGNGIPDAIKEKIFQPFFTTKPAGQGTGLGLSLSYDILKAHGGELKVETKEGEGSEFIISLPTGSR